MRCSSYLSHFRLDHSGLDTCAGSKLLALQVTFKTLEREGRVLLFTNEASFVIEKAYSELSSLAWLDDQIDGYHLNMCDHGIGRRVLTAKVTRAGRLLPAERIKT